MSPERAEFLDLLASLVAAKTVNPPGNEAAAAAVVERFFKAEGIPYETYEKAPGRTNIIGAVGSGPHMLTLAGEPDAPHAPGPAGTTGQAPTAATTKFNPPRRSWPSKGAMNRAPTACHFPLGGPDYS